MSRFKEVKSVPRNAVAKNEKEKENLEKELKLIAENSVFGVYNDRKEIKVSKKLSIKPELVLTKVYLVQECAHWEDFEDHYDTNIVKIFNKKEDAEKFVKENLEKMDDEAVEQCCGMLVDYSLDIYEREVE